MHENLTVHGDDVYNRLFSIGEDGVPTVFTAFALFLESSWRKYNDVRRYFLIFHSSIFQEKKFNGGQSCTKCSRLSFSCVLCWHFGSSLGFRIGFECGLGFLLLSYFC